jgi:hypothetical protein
VFSCLRHNLKGTLCLRRIFFSFFRKGKHEFYNVQTMVLEHVRCLLHEQKSIYCKTFDIKDARCKQSCISTSIPNTARIRYFFHYLFTSILSKRGVDNSNIKHTINRLNVYHQINHSLFMCLAL